MNLGQYDDLMGMLREIRDRLPRAAQIPEYDPRAAVEVLADNYARSRARVVELEKHLADRNADSVNAYYGRTTDPMRLHEHRNADSAQSNPVPLPTVGQWLAARNADDGASLVGPLCVHGFVADGQACGEFGCTKPASKQVAQSQALYAVLVTLDAWIEGVRSNHVASGHRGENTGEECWRTFTPADIRVMINDAARDLGLSEFPLPDVAKEDTV